MLLVVLGGILTWRLSSTLFRGHAQAGEAAARPPPAKLQASLTLAFWVGAIIAGRLTAYLP